MDPLLKLALMVAFCPAPSVLLWHLISRWRETSRGRTVEGLEPMRRRPAGESLRRHLLDLDQQIYAWLIYLAICPAILGLAAGLIRVPGLGLPIALFSASAVWTAICAIKLGKLHRLRAEVDLGFEARRRLAEELNRLSAEGFEIYHDVPFEKFHIDHVLIGPPGVFAVETVTHPDEDRAGTSAGPRRVVFDGFRLNWSKDSYGLENAVSRAGALRQWLNDLLGENVEVTPILTVPGWTIECTAPSPTALVLNSKEIGKLCDLKLVSLKEDLIRRICHHLNQRCESS